MTQGSRFSPSLTDPEHARVAPPWSVQQWFHAPDGFSLAALRGRVVALHAFQMLCPGCVSHGIPQAQRIAQVFGPLGVEVVGLHTVFEHHEAMSPVSLAAFLHEYRVPFPVGVDTPTGAGPIPATMAAYGMRGTPTLVLIDRSGRVRFHAFGRPEDMIVGAAVQGLLDEGAAPAASSGAEGDDAAITEAGDAAKGPGCDDEGCAVG